MYKLYKRKKVWHYRILRSGIRRTTGTEIRALAEEKARKAAEEYYKVSKLGNKPRKTWKEAAVKRLKSKTGKPSFQQEQISLRWLDKHLRNKYLDEITDEVIEAIKNACMDEGMSSGTANKRLQAISGALRGEKLSITIPWFPEPKKRVRWLTRDEAAKLFCELPPHLVDLARFSLSVGLRMSNVTRLEWSQVDLARRVMWVHADQYKTEEAMGFPLNADAILVLRKCAQPQVLPKVTYLPHPKYVFTYQGNPIKRSNGNAWRKALKRAGIDNFRWHDLRHTFASWHVQAGTHTHALKELGGWKDGRMVERYAHLDSGHLAEYAENLSKPRLVEKPAQTGHTEFVQEGKVS